MSVRTGIRIEFYDGDKELFAAVLREDVRTAAAPRPGDRFIPGTLTQAGALLLPNSPRVAHVEHAPRMPGVREEGEPLVMAVVRAEDAARAEVMSLRTAFEAEGWHWSPLS